MNGEKKELLKQQQNNKLPSNVVLSLFVRMKIYYTLFPVQIFFFLDVVVAIHDEPFNLMVVYIHAHDFV